MASSRAPITMTGLGIKAQRHGQGPCSWMLSESDSIQLDAVGCCRNSAQDDVARHIAHDET